MTFVMIAEIARAREYYYITYVRTLIDLSLSAIRDVDLGIR